MLKVLFPDELATILNKKVKSTNLSLRFDKFIKFRKEGGFYKSSLEDSVGKRIYISSEAYHLYRKYINLLKTKDVLPLAHAGCSPIF